jgi:hypothetical protein
MTVFYYKIRHKETGLFRCAGQAPKWNKQGKLFDKVSKLRLMLDGCMKHNARSNNRNIFADWEVVQYEVKEIAVSSIYEIITVEKVMGMLKK